MKTICCVLITLIGVSCNGQKTTFEAFKTELKEKTITFKKEKKVLNNLTINQPITFDSLSKSILERVISNELKKDFCDNKECKINMDFDLGYRTNKIVSIKMDANTVFRLPRDVESIEFYNFFLYQKELFEIKLNRTTNLESRIKKALITMKADVECNYLSNDNETVIKLFINNGESYVHLYKDEVCNILVKLDLNSSDLTFVKVSK
jgi:hypothetical protein